MSAHRSLKTEHEWWQRNTVAGLSVRHLMRHCAGLGSRAAGSCCGVPLLCGRRWQHPPHNKPPELRQQMVGFVLHSSVLRYSAIYYGLSGECGPVLILRTAGRPDMLLQHFHNFFWRFYESHTVSPLYRRFQRKTLLRARGLYFYTVSRARGGSYWYSRYRFTHTLTHTHTLPRPRHSFYTHSFIQTRPPGHAPYTRPDRYPTGTPSTASLAKLEHPCIIEAHRLCVRPR